MNVLLTGAFGNVGLSALRELLHRGHHVRTFDLKNRKNMRLAAGFGAAIEPWWCDIRQPETTQDAVNGIETVIHTAAVIPPVADRAPELAYAVNVQGTKNLIAAILSLPVRPKLIFTSSIAIYGDRRKNPMIKCGDALDPNPDDGYAKHKIECEKMIMGSGITWSIMRLTYIVSMGKLRMDPLMFRMPLETSIEICATEDAGLALANAVDCPGVWGRILQIAGGERCRTTYGEYISNMMWIFGLGRGFPPADSFAKEGFHYGFMDTTESQALLHYQRCTLDAYYAQVRKKVGFRRYLLAAIRPFARAYILNRSTLHKTRKN